MPPGPIKVPSPGQPIRAADLRVLADAIMGLRNITAGDGIEVSVTEKAVVLGLARAVSRKLGTMLAFAVITEANGAEPDDDPENVTYKARAIGETTELETARVPDFSLARIFNAKVVKAKVGDLCAFIRWTDDEGSPIVKLFVITEKAAVAECETTE